MLLSKPGLTDLRVNVEVSRAFKGQIEASMLTRAVQAALKAAGVRNVVEAAVYIKGDEFVRRLNRLYRGQDRVTDVLSFGLAQGGKFPAHPDGVTWLGDVVIAYPQCKRQARQYGHSPQEEAALLVIHGTLHLLGYDHEKLAAEARRMERMQRIALEMIGMPDISRI